MPPSKDNNSKFSYNRSFSTRLKGDRSYYFYQDYVHANEVADEMTMSAKVYHPATNLLPPTPPHSPTGLGQSFPIRTNSNTWSRQNSQSSGKYH